MKNLFPHDQQQKRQLQPQQINTHDENEKKKKIISISIKHTLRSLTIGKNVTNENCNKKAKKNYYQLWKKILSPFAYMTKLYRKSYKSIQLFAPDLHFNFCI